MKILSILLLISMPCFADDASEAKKHVVKGLVKLYGEEVKERAEVIIRRSGMSEEYVANFVIGVKALIEQRAKVNTKIYEYKVGVEYDYGQDKTSFFIKTSF